MSLVSELNRPTFAPLRREDSRLLVGAGMYVSDIQVAGLLHVVFVRSAQATGRIARLETTVARQTPEVVAVLTAEQLGDHCMPAINPLLPVTNRAQSPLLTKGTVTYLGQALAIVIGKTLQAANRGAQALIVEFEPNPTAPLHDFASAEPVTQVHYRDGQKPQRGVQHTASVHLLSPRVVAMAMEPRAAVASWDDARQQITMWLGTQTPSRAQADVAALLGLAIEDVHVITPDVGGAFGSKASIYPEELLLALAARHLKRALRWVSSRSEEFTSAMHGRGSKLDGELTLNAEGQLLSLQASMEFALGAWLPFSAVVPLRNAARILPGPYRLEHIDIEGSASSSNTAPVNIYRGAGRPEAALLMETLIDKAARAAGIDPVALRRKNLIAAADMPYRTPTGETFDSGDYLQALDRACARFDYDGERREQARRRARGEVVGIGVAMYVEPCGKGWEAARATLHADGSVTIASGTPAQGQGHLTTFAQIAATILGCSQSVVTVHCGDTRLSPEGVGTLASRSTAIGGSAIVKACEEAIARQRAGDVLPIVVESRFESAEAWSYGCVIVRMKIDRESGFPGIERVVWVDDAGNIVSPTLARGQLMGGFAQGLGQAMMERVVYDKAGQLLTGSLMDYAVPRAVDMPHVEIESMCTPSPANPLGAKGVGEAGCIGTPAALMNAARDALSVFGERELQFPLTSESLWRAMQ